MLLKRITTTFARPSLAWAVLACMLSFSCAHSVAEGPGGGATPGGTVSYTLADLDDAWVGVLSPDSDVLDPFNFYFISDDGGVVSDAVDSRGNRWQAEDSQMTAEILASGRMMVTFKSDIVMSNLRLDGNMSLAGNELTGTYQYSNIYGIPVRGTFILARSTGDDYFADLDFSGSWSGGFGVGYGENMRQIKFDLSADGTVISGEMTNRVTGHVIHEYLTGAGSFGLNLNTRTGLIEGFELTDSNGETAVANFLLLDHELTLVGGTGVDEQVGKGIIEVIRDRIVGN